MQESPIYTSNGHLTRDMILCSGIRSPRPFLTETSFGVIQLTRTIIFSYIPCNLK